MEAWKQQSTEQLKTAEKKLASRKKKIGRLLSQVSELESELARLQREELTVRGKLGNSKGARGSSGADDSLVALIDEAYHMIYEEKKKRRTQ